MKELLTTYRENVDKKLIIRQRIFLIIILVLTTINTLNVVHGKIDTTLAISGFLLSAVIGLLLSRMFNIFWHEEKGKVVSQLDRLGALLLVVYILVEVNRNWFFGYWLSGPALTTFGLIILSGLLFGRFLGTGFKVRKILKEEKSE